MALAAPVLLGTMLMAPARERRGSPLRCGPLDGPAVVQGLGHGRQAVGGAGSGGDDGIFGLQDGVVHVVDDGGQVVAGGRGDDNLAGASVDVGLALFLGGVEAGALQHDVHLQLAPGAIRSVLLGVDDDLMAVHDDGVVGGLNLVIVGVVALGGVILQQVRQHLGGGQVVDGDDLVALSAEHLTESQAADAAKTIDSNFNSHWNYLPKNSPLSRVQANGHKSIRL